MHTCVYRPLLFPVLLSGFSGTPIYKVVVGTDGSDD